VTQLIAAFERRNPATCGQNRTTVIRICKFEDIFIEDEPDVDTNGRFYAFRFVGQNVTVFEVTKQNVALGADSWIIIGLENKVE
jgi:hypothetical protein